MAVSLKKMVHVLSDGSTLAAYPRELFGGSVHVKVVRHHYGESVPADGIGGSVILIGEHAFLVFGDELVSLEHVPADVESVLCWFADCAESTLARLARV